MDRKNKERVQAMWVFKYYRLSNQKDIELYGRMGTCDYCKRSSQRRNSPVRRHSTRAEGIREKIKDQRQVSSDQPPHIEEQSRSKDNVLQR